MNSNDVTIFKNFWYTLKGDSSLLDRVSFTGNAAGLPSKYHVAPFASAAVASATLAVAEVLQRLREDEICAPVSVDRTHAAASYLGDQLAKPQGWLVDQDLNDISGNYQTADGWLRIHAMYAHHRQAAIYVLECQADRDEVVRKITKWNKQALETAIVGAGGCAAELRSPYEWQIHPQGAAVANESLFTFSGYHAASRRFFQQRKDPVSAPLAGLRVMDLTRVLAGPIGARFLAAYGADVIRIDPRDFFEPNSLLVETTRGKRTAGLNLGHLEDRNAFIKLLQGCDILIHGYRPGAMERLGFSLAEILILNPGLVVVRHNAYGWSGPWQDRRGFDSLVQMSCGISFDAPNAKPKPLPAQALDYTTGYLIAAAACRGLLEKHQETRLSLAKTAHELMRLGNNSDEMQKPFESLDSLMTLEKSDWGLTQQLSCPGRIDKIFPAWTLPAGKLGKCEPINWS